MNMKRIAIIILSILMPFLCDAQKPFERGKTLYMDGWYDEALPLLQTSAKEGYGEACYFLGNMYFYGWGVNVDYDIALRMYNRAAEYGYSDVEAELGMMSAYGFGCEKDLEKAEKLLKVSSEKGNLKGMYFLAVFYKKHGDPQAKKESFKLFKSLVQDKIFSYYQGYYFRLYAYYYHQALIALAEYCEEGIACPKDLNLAMYFYSMAGEARGDSFLASNGISSYKATMLTDRYNTYIISNPARYRGDLWSAVYRGYHEPFAYYYLSQTRKWNSDDDYIDYLSRAANGGIVKAQKMLSDYYKEGKYVPVNLLKSKEWYAKAVANGYDQRVEKDTVYRHSLGYYDKYELYHYEDMDCIVLRNYIDEKTGFVTKPSHIMDLKGYYFGFKSTMAEMMDFIKGKEQEGWELPNYADLEDILVNLDSINKVNAKIGKPLITESDRFFYSFGRIDNKTLDMTYEHYIMKLSDIKHGWVGEKYSGQSVKIYFVRNL